MKSRVRKVQVSLKLLQCMCRNKLYMLRLKKTPLDCLPDVIFSFVFEKKYAKTYYFVPIDYIGVVGIKAKKSRGNPHEKYRGIPKGGVI